VRVFDPERDDDDGTHRFYVRLLTIVGIALAVCIALYPSVTGFYTGPDGEKTCVAVADGWHGEKPAPDSGSVMAAFASYPPVPAPKQRGDPTFMARFRARMEAVDALPEVQQFNAYQDWLAGPGACIPKSRHRLIVSGIGLGVVAVVCAGVVIVRRTRKNLRRSPAELAGT
jgi:hypothetical protein